MWVVRLSRRVLRASTGFFSSSICLARRNTSMCSRFGYRGCLTMCSCSSVWQRLETNVSFAFTASMSYLKELYTVYLDSSWWQKVGNGSSLSVLWWFSAASFSSGKLKKKIARIRDLHRWRELSTSSKHMLQMMTQQPITLARRQWLISKKLKTTTVVLIISKKMEPT